MSGTHQSGHCWNCGMVVARNGGPILPVDPPFQEYPIVMRVYYGCGCQIISRYISRVCPFHPIEGLERVVEELQPHEC